MTTQKAINANAYKNKGGTIFGAGNFVSGNITNDISLLENTAKDHGYSKVIEAGGTAGESGNLGTYKPISGGTFQYSDAANNTWLMKGGNVTTKIAGASSSVLTSAASISKADNRRNPAYLNSTRRYHVSYWLWPSGMAVYGASRGAISNYANGVGGNADDTAAGSNAIPAEIVFMDGGKLPQQKDLPKRTSN